MTVSSQLLGLPLLGLGLLIVPGRWYPGDALWSALAGGAGLAGLVLLYRGLGTGAMTVVAPVTGVTAAVVPVGVGLATGERPTALALGGVACAVVAIALVSLAPGHPAARPSPPRAVIIGLSLLAGTMFGVFYSLLAHAHHDSGLWPLVVARPVAIGLGILLLLARGGARVPPRRLLGWVGLTGLGDIGANVLYLTAVHSGMLSLVAPIASLYPVSTVLLAVGVDRERVRPVQLVGLGLAATALVLTAV